MDNMDIINDIQKPRKKKSKSDSKIVDINTGLSNLDIDNIVTIFKKAVELDKTKQTRADRKRKHIDTMYEYLSNIYNSSNDKKDKSIVFIKKFMNALPENRYHEFIAGYLRSSDKNIEDYYKLYLQNSEIALEILNKKKEIKKAEDILESPSRFKEYSKSNKDIREVIESLESLNITGDKKQFFKEIINDLYALIVYDENELVEKMGKVSIEPKKIDDIAKNISLKILNEDDGSDDVKMDTEQKKLYIEPDINCIGNYKSAPWVPNVRDVYIFPLEKNSKMLITDIKYVKNKKVWYKPKQAFFEMLCSPFIIRNNEGEKHIVINNGKRFEFNILYITLDGEPIIYDDDIYQKEQAYFERQLYLPIRIEKMLGGNLTTEFINFIYYKIPTTIDRDELIKPILQKHNTIGNFMYELAPYIISDNTDKNIRVYITKIIKEFIELTNPSEKFRELVKSVRTRIPYVNLDSKISDDEYEREDKIESDNKDVVMKLEPIERERPFFGLVDKIKMYINNRELFNQLLEELDESEEYSQDEVQKQSPRESSRNSSRNSSRESSRDTDEESSSSSEFEDISKAIKKLKRGKKDGVLVIEDIIKCTYCDGDVKNSQLKTKIESKEKNKFKTANLCSFKCFEELNITHL